MSVNRSDKFKKRNPQLHFSVQEIGSILFHIFLWNTWRVFMEPQGSGEHTLRNTAIRNRDKLNRSNIVPNFLSFHFNKSIFFSMIHRLWDISKKKKKKRDIFVYYIEYWWWQYKKYLFTTKHWWRRQKGKLLHASYIDPLNHEEGMKTKRQFKSV